MTMRETTMTNLILSLFGFFILLIQGWFFYSFEEWLKQYFFGTIIATTGYMIIYKIAQTKGINAFNMRHHLYTTNRFRLIYHLPTILIILICYVSTSITHEMSIIFYTVGVDIGMSLSDLLFVAKDKSDR